MSRRWRRVTWLTAILAAVVFLWLTEGDPESVGANGGNGTTPDTPSSTTIAPDGSSPTSSTMALTGSVTVTGSSTVEPISALVAEQFAELRGGAVAVSVDGPGTGDGFKAFCAGEADINDASRAIKDTEIADCAENGVNYVGLAVAIDGLSVITALDDPVECLSFADLYALVGGESEGIDNWADAQALATELGSPTVLPDQALVVTAPGEESGTFDSFYELALKSINDDRVEQGLAAVDANGNPVKVRADYQSSSNDNVIVQGSAGARGALGWVGFAYADESRDRVKLLAIDEAGDGTCVAPTAATIVDGSYPLARTLYIYVNTDEAATNPALAAFVDFYLSDGGIANVEAADYVALDAARLATTRAAWESR